MRPSIRLRLTAWYAGMFLASFGFFGAIYAVAAIGLGGAFLTLAVRLQRRADRKSALRTYLFSLAYLALLFGVMVADVRL